MKNVYKPRLTIE